MGLNEGIKIGISGMQKAIVHRITVQINNTVDSQCYEEEVTPTAIKIVHDKRNGFVLQHSRGDCLPTLKESM